MNTHEVSGVAKRASQAGASLLVRVLIVIVPIVLITFAFEFGQNWWDSRTRVELSALSEAIAVDQRILDAAEDGIKFKEAAIAHRKTNGDGPSFFQPTGYNRLYTLSIQQSGLESSKKAYASMSDRISSERAKVAEKEESLKRRWSLRWFVKRSH